MQGRQLVEHPHAMNPLCSPVERVVYHAIFEEDFRDSWPSWRALRRPRPEE